MNKPAIFLTCAFLCIALLSTSFTIKVRIPARKID